VEKESMLDRIPHGAIEILDSHMQVTALDVRSHSGETVIEYRIVSSDPTDVSIIEALKQRAIGALNESVILEVQWVIRK
jgi:hypothetical protein